MTNPLDGSMPAAQNLTPPTYNPMPQQDINSMLPPPIGFMDPRFNNDGSQPPAFLPPGGGVPPSFMPGLPQYMP